MTKEQATVFLVDDDEVILDSLIWLFKPLHYQVKTYPSAQAFLQNYKTATPACLVSDIRMQSMTGLELQDELKKRQIALPMVFMSAHADVPMSVRAMKKGAIDFLTKPINNQQLLESVNKAIQYDKDTRQRLEERSRAIVLCKTLTEREQQVMVLMVKGNTSKEIAKKLNISPNTVELHRGKVLRKMRVSSLVELVQLTIRNSLFDSLPD